MTNSKYSIHDLSRCKGEGDANLARFNMPLELGMALALRNASTNFVGYDWLLLVPPGHVYKKFVSDLSGYDPEEYDGTAATAVPTVMSWLATRPDAVSTPKPKDVLKALPKFRDEVDRLHTVWLRRPPWADLVCAAIDVATRAKLI
jgi:hypothetical protein